MRVVALKCIGFNGVCWLLSLLLRSAWKWRRLKKDKR
jgi:hypothetical protein